MKVEISDSQKPYAANKMHRAVNHAEYNAASCAKCGHSIDTGEWCYRDIDKHLPAHIACPRKKAVSA